MRLKLEDFIENRKVEKVGNANRAFKRKPDPYDIIRPYRPSFAEHRREIIEFNKNRFGE